MQEQWIQSRFIDGIAEPLWDASDKVVVTCYFTSKADPQAGVDPAHPGRVAGDNYDYIRPWYESMVERGLHGIIFHDELSGEFVQTHETERIRFKKCGLGPYSLNDERFFIYYQYFAQTPYQYVLMTDVSDVRINRNPFELVNCDKFLYIGKDQDVSPVLRVSEWCLSKADLMVHHSKGQLDIDEDFFEMPVLNAGTIGGSRASIVELLRRMLEVFVILDNDLNNNMMVLHYVLYHWFGRGISDHVVTGYPLVSEFKRYQHDSDAYIIHK